MSLVFKKTTFATICIFGMSIMDTSFMNPTHSTHIIETNPDTTLGLIKIASTFIFLVSNQSFNPLVNHIGITGYIGYCTPFTFFGTIFMIVFVKESKGLTDKEQKQLYRPAKLAHVVEDDDIPDVNDFIDDQSDPEMKKADKDESEHSKSSYNICKT